MSVPYSTPSQYRLGIIGSRNYNNQEHFDLNIKKVTEEILEGKTLILVVSGGCRGADTMGEKWAADNKIQTLILKPESSLNRHESRICSRVSIFFFEIMHALPRIREA